MAIRGEPRGHKEHNPNTFYHVASELPHDQEKNAIRNESTLTESDLFNAIDTLPSIMKVSRPSNEVENESWTLAAALAFFRFFQVNLQENTTNYLAGKSVTLGMTYPFGRDQFDRTTNIVLSHEFGGDFKGNKLDFRSEVMMKLMYEQFDVIEKWIDIAKRAKEEYTVEDILKIENIEQRMAALRIFGAEKLLEESHAKLISKSARGNELYRIPKEQGFFDEDAYYLKYKCVSTDRIYVSGVPAWLFNQQMAVQSSAIQDEKNMGKQGYGIWWSTPMVQIEEKYLHKYNEKEFADLAMAWKFNLTLEEYKSLSREHEG